MTTPNPASTRTQIGGPSAEPVLPVNFVVGPNDHG